METIDIRKNRRLFCNRRRAQIGCMSSSGRQIRRVGTNGVTISRYTIGRQCREGIDMQTDQIGMDLLPLADERLHKRKSSVAHTLVN